jgi:hypothetical protein
METAAVTSTAAVTTATMSSTASASVRKDGRGGYENEGRHESCRYSRNAKFHG